MSRLLLLSKGFSSTYRYVFRNTESLRKQPDGQKLQVPGSVKNSAYTILVLPFKGCLYGYSEGVLAVCSVRHVEPMQELRMPALPQVCKIRWVRM